MAKPLLEALSTLAASRDGRLDAGALAVVKRLFVCPDRELAYVPLSVLLPDDWEIVWEPSATVYELLAQRRLRRGRGVLGLGDPDYRTVADPGALATRGGPRLTPLPGTRREVEGIMSMTRACSRSRRHRHIERKPRLGASVGGIEARIQRSDRAPPLGRSPVLGRVGALGIARLKALWDRASEIRGRGAVRVYKTRPLLYSGPLS